MRLIVHAFRINLKICHFPWYGRSVDDVINPSSDSTNELIISSHKNVNNSNNCKIGENNIVKSDVNTTEIIVDDTKKIKVGLSPSKKNCLICFNGSPLKMMKNAFYFIFYDVTTWLTNNYNTHIDQYLTK